MKKEVKEIGLAFILMASILIGWMLYNSIQFDKYLIPASKTATLANYANTDNYCLNPDIVCEGEK